MGTEVWAWQDGTSEWDRTGGVSVGPNGSCTIAGWTHGNWSSKNVNAGVTDWVAFNLDANKTLRWKWQNGTAHREALYATATGGDGSVVMVGAETFDASGDRFAAVKLDANGEFLWEWKDESRATAKAYAVASTEDGGVIWAGSAFGEWGEVSAGSYDFLAATLDENGVLGWTWQNGTSQKDELHAVVVGDDGTVVLAGYTHGNWSGAHRESNDSDFAAIKLDGSPDKIEFWTWQNGTTADDTIYGAAPGHDGSIVLAGSTGGDWKGVHAGGTNDFAAVKLDADGGEVWRWQDGTTGDDIITAVAPGDDWSFILAGYTKGSWDGASDGSYDFAAVKLDANGTEVWRWQGGSTVSAADYGRAVAAGPNGSVFFAGTTEGNWEEEDDGGYDDFVVVRLDAGAAKVPSLDIVGTNTPGPSLPLVVPTSPASTSRAPVSRAPASLAPTLTGPGTMRTPSPEWSSVAPAQVVSTEANSVWLTVIGVVAMVALVFLVVAGLCLRRKHQAKQKSGDEVNRDEPAIEAKPDRGAATPNAAPSESCPPKYNGGCDVVQAALEAANNLARNSQFPGVCEAAVLVSTLVKLISNDRGRIAESEARLKRCRLLVTMLERAALVLGKIDDVKDTDTSKDMKSMLIENVQDAIGDMVSLIKTYSSKRRVTQVVVSTLFKRRMEETEAVIDQTFSDLARWLHIDTALNQEEDRRTLVKRRHKATRVRRRLDVNKQYAVVGPHLRRTTAELQAESIVSDRHLRRKRNLNQIEIPEDHVIISEDVLGKGGFGTVYLADYNGRNAAAKVIRIDHDNGQLSSGCIEDAEPVFDEGDAGGKRQRASLLLELQAMIRLRSPHTVNVYGAITSRKDKLVLVMELLTGGDLLSLLRHSTERIAEPQARTIIQDVCAGMAFLHSKSAVHGDLKSANVLLDGEGRAKIGDFGTSRWAQHSNSTGLATITPTQGNVSHTMSFAWAAPEVLSSRGTSCASDVYSFGIVAWEVLSMEIPWADEALPFDIYTRVVFKGDRPLIPADAPADIAGILRACWAAPPAERPASAEILDILKARALSPQSRRGSTEHQ